MDSVVAGRKEEDMAAARRKFLIGWKENESTLCDDPGEQRIKGFWC
jgi:hypothetical protein